MHAMAPNVAGVIGSAIAAGFLWSYLVPPVKVVEAVEVVKAVVETIN